MAVRLLVFPAIVVLSLLDAVTTLAGLEAGGVELNPLAGLLVPVPALFIGAKLLVPVVAWVLWERSRRRWWPVVPLPVLVGVVVWNAGQLYG